jgi:hypothetical protein
MTIKKPTITVSLDLATYKRVQAFADSKSKEYGHMSARQALNYLVSQGLEALK